jgi:ketosteroid isomerase-like protein
MSSAKNTNLVLKFYELMSKREFEDMFELMSDDATWTVAGRPESFWPAGTQTKAQRSEVFHEFAKVFADMPLNVLSSTAEEDRVVLEARTRSTTHSGIVYENEFLILFRCRDNKIVSIYEHCDQQAVLEFARAVSSAENTAKAP